MKKPIVWLLAVAAACSHDSTGPAAPVPSQVVVTSPQSIVTVNTSVQLVATVYDENHKAIAGQTVQWQSLQPQIASVSAGGLVTGVAVGSATIRASLGNLSGDITLQVDPDPCITPLSMQTGQVRQLTGPAAVACITLAATSGPSDFLFITANATQTVDDLAFYSVGVQQVGASTTASMSLQSIIPYSSLSAAPQVVDANIRQQERALIPQFAPRRSAMLSVVPGEPSLAEAPGVGQAVSYNVPNVHASDLCVTYTTVQAVVKAVTAHAVIVQDVTAPTNGFSVQDFADIGAEWESLVYPTDTMYFGGPSDRNADGHITILYTSEVNRATSAGSSSFIAGFFWGGDLYKKSEYAQINKQCPQTNEQEIFYMLVPDPLGTINGNQRAVSVVKQNTRGTLAHEFQHMINQGVRLLNPAVDSSETVWLNEALSHLAEEIAGRAFRRFTDFQNLTITDVNPNPALPDDYNAFFRQNLTRLRPWMQRPDTASATSNKAVNQLAPRGAGWMFLRYLTDQFSNNNAKAYLRHLAAGPDIGIRNLVQWSGGVQFDDMLRGFLVSQFTDDFNVPGLSPVYTVRSWNVRDVMAAVNSNVFPLLVPDLQPVNPQTQSLAGSGNYYRLRRTSASPATTFRMLSPNGSPLTAPGVRVYVVRLS